MPLAVRDIKWHYYDENGLISGVYLQWAS